MTMGPTICPLIGCTEPGEHGHGTDETYLTRVGTGPEFEPREGRPMTTPKPTTGPEAIVDRFRYHRPTPGVAETHEELRDATMDLALLFDAVLEDGREKSLALTALEEALMRANQSVALNGTTIDRDVVDLKLKAASLAKAEWLNGD